VAAIIKPYLDKARTELKTVVGQASADFVFGNNLPRQGETALGDLICDSVQWYFTQKGQNVDFTFINGGNIRAALPKGDITREQVLSVLPFENYLYLASLKGTDIIRLFQYMATIRQGAGAFPQFSSEVRCVFDKTGGSGVVKELTINGKPVNPDKNYRFCTNGYILNGGDGYAFVTKSAEQVNTNLLLSDVVFDYIKAHSGALTPRVDGRLRVLIAPQKYHTGHLRSGGTVRLPAHA
jgi:5'-nucleotidase/UDP-sugar diphosphatase